MNFLWIRGDHFVGMSNMQNCEETFLRNQIRREKLPYVKKGKGNA